MSVNIYINVRYLVETPFIKDILNIIYCMSVFHINTRFCNSKVFRYQVNSSFGMNERLKEHFYFHQLIYVWVCAYLWMSMR